MSELLTHTNQSIFSKLPKILGKLSVLLFFVYSSPSLYAQDNQVLPQSKVDESLQLYTPAPYAQELKNRFRIDHKVEQINLIIKRDYGSAPVVVVLPDGSKWYSSRHPENVSWVDGLTGDIIAIPNPTAGPWQVLGQVLDGSMIEMVSEINIDVEPLPQPLYQGERLKVVARLTADDLTLRMPGMDYMVEWTSKFVSQHQPGDDNFAVGTVIVGSYKDDGEELDERYDDGVFTGRQNLDQPAGHYLLQVTARNNVFERQFSMPFKLSKQPVNIEMIAPDDPLKGIWKLQVDVDAREVLLSQTHIHMELTGPAGLQVPLLAMELERVHSFIELPNVSDFGSYRVKGHIATTTIGGREIIIDIPEMFFNLVEPPKPPPSAEELAARAAEIAKLEEAAAKDKAIKIIIIANIVLLVLAGVVFVIWRKKLALKKALAAAEQKLKEEEHNQPQTDHANGGLTDIDLTLPDD